MSALSRFEQFIEQLMEGTFTRLMRSQLQPVEIAKKLTRAMEDSQTVSAGGRILVANQYDVLLSPQDYALFEPYRASLEDELAGYVSSAAKERGFALPSQAVVTIASSPKAMSKRPLVKAAKSDIRKRQPASTNNETASPNQEEAALSGQTSRLNLGVRPAVPSATRAYLRVRGRANGERIPVSRSPFTVGRGLDNELVLEDSRVSRHHARIEELNKRLLLLDLRSTNGTSVNGEGISRCLLRNGDVISLGGLELVVEVEERA